MKAANLICQPLVEELLASGIEVKVQVTGSSMYPTVRSGDVVHVRPIDAQIPPARVSRGDIVLFRNSAGRFCLHRVTAREANRVETQGDAVVTADGFVPYSALKGIAVAVARGAEGREISLQNRLPRWTARYGSVLRRSRRRLRALLQTARSLQRQATARRTGQTR